jgi:hypothetical protein
LQSVNNNQKRAAQVANAAKGWRNEMKNRKRMTLVEVKEEGRTVSKKQRRADHQKESEEGAKVAGTGLGLGLPASQQSPAGGGFAGAGGLQAQRQRQKDLQFTE